MRNRGIILILILFPVIVPASTHNRLGTGVRSQASTIQEGNVLPEKRCFTHGRIGYPQSDLRHAQHRQEAARHLLPPTGAEFRPDGASPNGTRHSPAHQRSAQAHFSQSRQDSSAAPRALGCAAAPPEVAAPFAF